MSLTGTFRFHAVGQGLFYSGILNTKQKTFSFVYDCGTKSSIHFLQKEIDEFKELLPGKKKSLDLLIVSHLHDDHVNGLEYLLRDLAVDTVVIPYTDDIISFTALAESSGEDNFLLSFYADPIKWFSDRNVTRILMINGENNNDQQSEEGSLTFEGKRSLLSFSRISSQDYNGISLFKLHDNTQITVDQILWKFQFRNMKLNIEKEYKKIVNDFRNNRGVTLEAIFRDNDLKNEFVNEVKKVTKSGKKINQTSVVVIHEPIQDYHEQKITTKFGCPLVLSDYFCYKMKPNYVFKTILTGDLELDKNNEDLKNDLVKNAHRSVFQYPHHGAEGNHLGRLAFNGVLIIPVGIANKYDHPSDALGFDYCQCIYMIVNERNAFDYVIICKKVESNA